MMEMAAPSSRRPVPTEEQVIEADACPCFPVGRSGFWGQQVKWVHAVDDVSFTVHRRDTRARR